MRIDYDPLAVIEIAEARDWYDGQSDGLGQLLLDEYEQALQVMLRYPRFHRQLAPAIHRSLLKRFPYQIVFGFVDPVIYILAFAHLHRRPNYWIDRVK